ncbi:hypothetical protein LTR62_007307 [Meristemomyces frigidus]|uniref:Uncharacterized protein n=1 Tax=Meristemomyces frigidus TaxID=1508187 RepID=A0AAN7THF0_9PEZI|nr:hypothetical protein LTR62_007307 [Meristemomyces frigidus]
MHLTILLTALVLSSTRLVSASPLSTSHPLERRSTCGWTPGQKNGKDWTTTSLFLLRVEESKTNSTIGYLDGRSSPYARLTSRSASTPAFIAPYYNNYGSLIFWAGNGTNATDTGFTADDNSLPSSEATLPVTTEGCGTKPVYTSAKYQSVGSCTFGGNEEMVRFRCPLPGTANDTPSPCFQQVYYACTRTGLEGVADDEGVIFFGNTTTAVPNGNCCEVDLVSECP